MSLLFTAPPMLLSRQLEKIRKELLHMGALCEESVDASVRAILTRDAELARSVIAKDDAIDDAEIELEEECLHALALYQPVAFDLRYVVAVLKINSDLERIGDLATSLAEAAVMLANRPQAGDIPFDLLGMSRTVQEMLHKSLNALVALDPKLAADVRAQDDTVDDIHRGVYEAVQKMIHDDPRSAELAIAYLGLSRKLERMADHAAYIARDVIVLTEGDFSSYHPRADKSGDSTVGV